MTRTVRRNAPQFELHLQPRVFQPVAVNQPALHEQQQQQQQQDQQQQHHNSSSNTYASPAPAMDIASSSDTGATESPDDSSSCSGDDCGGDEPSSSSGKRGGGAGANMHHQHHQGSSLSPSKAITPSTTAKGLLGISPAPPTASTSAQGRRWNFSATKICDGLFLGSYVDAMNPEELQTMGIRRILNVAGECPVEKAVSERFTAKHVELRDHSDENISSVFDECSNFIKEGIESGEDVLVHCRMGVSRSTTIVLAYLMKFGTNVRAKEFSELTYHEAFDYVKNLRPEVSPNLGFVLALHELDRQRGFEYDESTFTAQTSLEFSN